MPMKMANLDADPHVVGATRGAESSLIVTGPPVRALTTPAPIALTAATMAPDGQCSAEALAHLGPASEPEERAPAKIAPLDRPSPMGRSPSVGAPADSACSVMPANG